MTTKSKPSSLDYVIQSPFRLNGRWHTPEEKTIKLLPRQAQFFLLNGKLAKPSTKQEVTK